MTPEARLQAAIDVLGQWQAGTPVERALTGWARGARYAGSKDRRAVRDHVYDVLRQKGNCADAGQGDSPRALILGLARLNGLAPELFSGAGYGPEALTPLEAQIFDTDWQADPARDTPEWLKPALNGAMAEWPEIEAQMGRRAPLYLRVNLARVSRAEAQASLASDGIETSDCTPDTALEVTQGAPKVAQSAAFAQGWVEPQDLSVQLACARVAWPQGRILDFCAGGGGKALAIAAATGGSVEVHDAVPRRMSDLPARAARAGADLQITTAPDGPYALVLTDVPCSGSGTWRRDPEAKWQLTEAKLAELCALQGQILRQAADLTDRIVYMTCSYLDAENRAQINGFLADHSGWSCVQDALYSPLNGSDGFFVAELCLGL